MYFMGMGAITIGARSRSRSLCVGANFKSVEWLSQDRHEFCTRGGQNGDTHGLWILILIGLSTVVLRLKSGVSDSRVRLYWLCDMFGWRCRIRCRRRQRGGVVVKLGLWFNALASRRVSPRPRSIRFCLQWTNNTKESPATQLAYLLSCIT